METKRGSELVPGDVLEVLGKDHRITRLETGRFVGDLPTGRIAYAGEWGMTVFDTDWFHFCEVHSTWANGGCLPCYKKRVTR